MGCGASSPHEVGSTTDRFDQQSREEKRDEVLEKHKLSEKEKVKVLGFPIFKIPYAYAEEHAIECVFFGVKDETCTEVTVFFVEREREEQLTERYGINFSLCKDDEKLKYSRVVFNHCWSGEDVWESPVGEETRTHTEPYDNFTKEGTSSRPVLFVNTKSHFMGTRNCNGGDVRTFSEYRMYSGTPKQATEILLRASEAAYPERKEVPPLAQLIPVRTSHAPPKDKRN
eukprot:NODE_4039_length_873_cov_56.872573_g3725_i0.p1 GENE.NODE_4039_length_873_cov_56.872573_g3725_i0~~NODE_4039_length_873_cov_56.872573_g3725_i0.p1  ORF type:complete len:228 (-),score=32.28 NODE_4039_length_873_cov_56.872573_g3725_i0:121-804(-)